MMTHPRVRAAAGLAMILSLAAAPAWSQFAEPPASAAQLPWVSAYKACAEAALMRRFADTPAVNPPPPGDLVAQAEHDCANRVPFVGSSSSGDALVVQAIVGAEHRDLMRHFHRGANLVTTVLPPPVPTRMSVGDGATCPRPEYPPAAIRASATGVSRVTLAVGADGRVITGTLIGASGSTREHRLLDDAAVASFRECEFPRADGAQPRTITMDYTWRLD